MAERYFSQFKQDKFLNEVLFNHKQQGFFVDIGAHDGVTISNSLYFEKCKEWKGICIEPNPNVFSKLQSNRQSMNLNVCVGNGNQTVKFTQIEGYSEMLSGISDQYNEKHLERIQHEIKAKGGKMIEIDVEMITLDKIDALKNQKIDFISIDTEGNEFEIVKSIDFDLIHVTTLVIENNYNDNRIKDHLNGLGYVLIFKLDCDEIFLCKKDYSMAVKFRILFWELQTLSNKIAKKLGI